MSLRLVPDLPDPASKPLPPKWDGTPVAWMTWEPAPHVIICRESEADSGCTGCGYAGPGWQTRPNHTKVPLDLRGLRVDRCANCLHDQVIDITTWQVWDLDPLDYGPEGSRDWSAL